MKQKGDECDGKKVEMKNNFSKHRTGKSPSRIFQKQFRALYISLHMTRRTFDVQSFHFSCERFVEAREMRNENQWETLLLTELHPHTLGCLRRDVLFSGER